MARVIDSDAHVVEGREFMAQMMERFPDKIRFASPARRHGALHRGPPLPEVERPRRRLPRRGGHVPRPRRQSLHRRGRARRRRPGRHRRHGVLPERRARPAGLRGSALRRRDGARLQRVDGRLVRTRPGRASTASAWCRSRTSRRRSGSCARRRQLGLVAIMVPAVLKERNLDHPDLEPFYARGRPTSTCRSASTARRASICRTWARTASTTICRCTA